jgi:hypothetical protein
MTPEVPVFTPGNNWRFALVIAGLAIGVVACAGRPIFQQARPSIAPATESQVRIFVYQRDGVTPLYVKVNGRDVGKLPRRGVLCIDVAPGPRNLFTTEGHTGFLDMKLEAAIFVDTDPGGTVFLEEVLVGNREVLIRVPEEEALAALSSLPYQSGSCR